MPTTTPTRMDRKLGPRLPPVGLFRVKVLRRNFVTGEYTHSTLSTHKHIDDAVAALHATRRPGFIEGEKRGRVRTTNGEWWLVNGRKR